MLLQCSPSAVELHLDEVCLVGIGPFCRNNSNLASAWVILNRRALGFCFCIVVTYITGSHALRSDIYHPLHPTVVTWDLLQYLVTSLINKLPD